MAEAKSICAVDGCSRPVKIVKRGLCSAHYMAAWKSGALASAGIEARVCLACANSYVPVHVLSKYCSQRCVNKARDQKRGPSCGVCGKKMYPARSMAKVPTCQECRRSRSGYRDRLAASLDQECTCIACGEVWFRPAVRGSRPKWCADCRRTLGNREVRVSRSVRLSIYQRDGWKCWLCERDVDEALIGTASRMRPSLDHVVPFSAGGGDEPSNLRLAHMWCNAVRSDGRTYSPEDFRGSNRIGIIR